jgi:hypothetical protein
MMLNNELDTTSASDLPNAGNFDDWLQSLSDEQKAVFLNDETALPKAAFDAAFQLGQASIQERVNYRYVARRDPDTTTWSDTYFNGGFGYAHETSIKKALQAKSLEKLYEAMNMQLTGYGGIKQAVGSYTIYKIARNQIVETVTTRGAHRPEKPTIRPKPDACRCLRRSVEVHFLRSSGA